MDKEIGRFIRDLEELDSDREKRRRNGEREPKAVNPDRAAGTPAVASEMTGVMPAGLGHGDEIEEYQDLFPGV